MSRIHFTYQPGDCQTHVYQHEDGSWWRYCFTCDDGSNKRQRHQRGHRTERDARMSERDHVLQLRSNRAAHARLVKWSTRLCAATTWDEFILIYCERFTRVKPFPEPVDGEELMERIQGTYRKRFQL